MYAKLIIRKTFQQIYFWGRRTFTDYEPMLDAPV